MFASIYAVIGVAMYETGGISQIWQISNKYKRIQFNKYLYLINLLEFSNDNIRIVTIFLILVLI